MKSRRIREAGEQEAAGGPASLAEEFDAARARLAARRTTMPLDRSVGVFAHVLPLDQCPLTRFVELVVHLDDLAVRQTERFGSLECMAARSSTATPQATAL